MSNNSKALKAKISKLGATQLAQKIKDNKFTAEELVIAKEIAAARAAKSKATPPKAAPAAKPTEKSAAKKDAKAPAKDAKPAAPKAKDAKAPAKSNKKEVDKNYGKSEFVREQLRKGIRSHKEIAELVLATYGSKLYYSEYDRCRKQVDQRPADKKAPAKAEK